MFDFHGMIKSQKNISISVKHKLNEIRILSMDINEYSG